MNESITEKTPSIAIDITFLQDQYRNRGIGRYGREMASRIIQKITKFSASELQASKLSDLGDLQIGELKNAAREDYILHLIGFGKLEENLKLMGFENEVEALSKSPALKFHTLGKARLSRPIGNLWQYYFKIRPLVKQIQPQLYFAAHFDRGLPSDLVKTVVAIHDAIPLITGKFSSQGKFINFLKGLFYKFMWQKAKAAEVILTSSEFSKRDLVTYGGLDHKKVQVVYLGISDTFRKENFNFGEKAIFQTLAKYGIKTIVKAGSPIPMRYLIYDAGLEANKNVPLLLEVFAKLMTHIPDLELVITGGDFQLNPKDGKFMAMNERAEALINKALELEIAARIVPTGRISEEEITILLSQAYAYINLSNYEGFGFGPLQAMAAGIPAITSNRSCFPEVCGDAAIQVDIDDPLRMSASILEFLSSNENRTEAVAKGLELAKKYNWEDTFSKTWGIITGRHAELDSASHKTLKQVQGDN